MIIEDTSKTINKIEIFRPKRKYNAPVNPDIYVRKGDTVKVSVSGIELTIENTREQNVYVRLK